MTRLWSPLRERFGDAFVLAVAVAAQVEIWVEGFPGSRLLLIVFTLLWTLPFLWRRRFPFLVPIFVLVALLVEQTVRSSTDILDDAWVASLVLFLGVFWVLGAYNNLKRALAGYVFGLAVFAGILAASETSPLTNLAFAALISGTVVVVGAAFNRRSQQAAELTERTAQLERLRDEEARIAVFDERTRIARELHDVIAHSVSVMTVQAGAARLMLDQDPKRALEPVAAVEETGRQALAELRLLLGILRTDMSEPELEPQPGMAGLESLLEQVRQAGLPVELTVEGVPLELSPGVDLTGYRVVQEALTNALKHGGPGRARVAVRYQDGAVDLEIENEAAGPGRRGGSGKGLVGMRERIALYGGELEAGSTDTGYLVRARLPLTEQE